MQQSPLLHQPYLLAMSFKPKLQPHVRHIGLLYIVALWPGPPEHAANPVLFAFGRKGADEDAVARYLAHVNHRQLRHLSEVE